MPLLNGLHPADRSTGLDTTAFCSSEYTSWHYCSQNGACFRKHCLVGYIWLEVELVTEHHTVLCPLLTIEVNVGNPNLRDNHH